MTIKTPLTYSDALELAEDAMALSPILARHRIAKALMSVDQASREQSGAKELLGALKSAGDALANECELKAAGIIEAAIHKHDPESEPIANVEARQVRAFVEAMTEVGRGGK